MKLIQLQCVYLLLFTTVVWCKFDSFHELPVRNDQLLRLSSVSNTWTKTTASNYNWHSIASDSTGRYLVTCSNNLKGIYISSTYGVSWTQSSAPTTYDYTGVASSSSGEKLVAVIGGTVAGGIYLSPDTGLTWIQSTTAPSEAWNSVTCDSTCTNVVAVIYSSVLSSGGIYFSTNGGVLFAESNAPQANWNGVASDSTGQFVVAVIYNTVIGGGGIYRSVSYGATWTQVSDLTYDWTGIASDSTGTRLVAVSSGGTIATSTDSGTTWTVVAMPSYNYNCVSMDSTGLLVNVAINSNVGEVGSGGGIYRSTDGGNTWTLSDAPGEAYTSISSDSTGAYVFAASTNDGVWGVIYSQVTEPTVTPTQAPVVTTAAPVADLTVSPSLEPTFAPVPDSTLAPTSAPVADSTVAPTAVPISDPTVSPTLAPVPDPTAAPSLAPASDPSASPTAAPVPDATMAPTPTSPPSSVSVPEPTVSPTSAPVVDSTASPTVAPVPDPTISPSSAPVSDPSVPPTATPVPDPTLSPSSAPVSDPSVSPTATPVPDSTALPTAAPVIESTAAPTNSPSAAPTVTADTYMPSSVPVADPSHAPTSRPSSPPSSVPTRRPAAEPTSRPSSSPLAVPRPIAETTTSPSSRPTAPSVSPTYLPPTAIPSAPSAAPTVMHTKRPTASPSRNDTSSQILSFTTNMTLTGLTSTVFSPASQTSLITTNADIMHVAITDVSFVGSITVTGEVTLLVQIPLNKRSLRHVTAPLATFSAVAITLTQVAMSSTVFPSPEALYASLTSALTAAVQDGVYNTVLANSAVVYGASQLTGATATAVSYSPEAVSEISMAPTVQPTGSPRVSSSQSGGDLQLILETVSIAPGILLMLVGAFTIRYRRPRESSLNQLRSLSAEYGHLFIRGVTLVLSVNLLLTSSLAISDPTFLLLLVSRLLILALCVVFFLFFIFPAKEEVNSVTGTSLLIRTDVLQQNGAVSVYSVVIVMGLFDISMLRYLPWFRTSFTAVMDGYPNILLVRCSLYGTFFSSVIQTAAVLPALIAHNHTSTKTEIKIVALLVFNVINIVRSFTSIILHMKKVKDVDFKLAIVSEGDVAALADFVSSTEHSSQFTSKDSRAPIAPDKVSDMLSLAARSTSSRSHADSTASTLNVQNLGVLGAQSTENPLHSTRTADEDLMSEMTEEVDVDDRGILFATKINHADETVNILRDQVRLAGQRPLEFIPLSELKYELEKLFECANSGVPYDTDRLDYLLLCLDHNPEYKAEQEAANRAWRAEIEPFLADSLSAMQAFIPPHIFKCSEGALVQEYGYSKTLAKRILVKKCLWLVRISSSDIDRMHIAELNGRFNPEAQNLDVVEAAAIFAVLPVKFGLDADRRKTRWRASIEQNLKTLYSLYQAGTLPGPRKRNPAYKDQIPAFDGRETLHEMSATKTEDAFAPRTSFLHLSLPQQVLGVSNSGSGSGCASPQSGSYVQQVGQSLSRDLFQKPRTPAGNYEPELISGNNRSSLTLLPSAVNSPAGSIRKTGSASPQVKSSNFGSELTKALSGRKQIAPSKKTVDDDML